MFYLTTNFANYTNSIWNLGRKRPNEYEQLLFTIRNHSRPWSQNFRQIRVIRSFYFVHFQ